MLRLPLRALFSLVVERVRFPSKILPVVCVYTCVPCMRGITIGAPDSLEVKHVKVGTKMIILITEFMKEVYCDLNFRMCECTHISIVAGFNAGWVTLAELDFVLLRMIELFYAVVSARAAIAQRTFVTMFLRDDVLTDLRGVGTESTSSVFFCFMIVEAFLGVMLIAELAWLSLKIEEVYLRYTIVRILWSSRFLDIVKRPIGG